MRSWPRFSQRGTLMVESIHDEIDRTRKELQPNAEKINIYRDYSIGKQRGTISADQMAILLSLTGHDHADNVSDTVIATGASRLEFLGYTCEDVPVQTFLDEFYIRNSLAEVQYDVHYAMGRDGTHALSLSWLPQIGPGGTIQPGAGRPVVSHEPWWNGHTGMFVAFEPDGRTKKYAVKDFRQNINGRDRLRRVIWFPDHIERFIKDGAGWQTFRLDGDPEDGFIRWEKRDGSPLGIPVVVFANGRFGLAPYGESDLAGGVVGLQDDVNDFQRDLSAAGRLTAYSMYWVTGHDLGKNPMTVGPGQMMYASSKEANFGSFAPGSLEEIIRGLREKIATIARVTQTPQHLITGGDWPSGEALIRAETPLVDRTSRNKRSVDPSWTEAGHRSTEMFNAFGRGALDENAMITTEFTPPERLDELTLSQIESARVNQDIALLELGYSKRFILKKRGLTDAEITAMEKERSNELAISGQSLAFQEPTTDNPITG
jgi:hypothetical protein